MPFYRYTVSIQKQPKCAAPKSEVEKDTRSKMAA